jgi:hypothetical protein
MRFVQVTDLGEHDAVAGLLAAARHGRGASPAEAPPDAQRAAAEAGGARLRNTISEKTGWFPSTLWLEALERLTAAAHGLLPERFRGGAQRRAAATESQPRRAALGRLQGLPEVPEWRESQHGREAAGGEVAHTAGGPATVGRPDACAEASASAGASAPAASHAGGGATIVACTRTAAEPAARLSGPEAGPVRSASVQGPWADSLLGVIASTQFQVRRLCPSSSRMARRVQRQRASTGSAAHTVTTALLLLAWNFGCEHCLTQVRGSAELSEGRALQGTAPRVDERGAPLHWAAWQGVSAADMRQIAYHDDATGAEVSSGDSGPGDSADDGQDEESS